eukprot:TRINITY_DN28515_c0_g1_i1.p1 TRINITY_DN28515_c0_g1~~TRINITY_DN28515_c0_g1_i1.p1  ORF type:complete len:134 (+),score=21.66 TRINITY_DN28515_c0_g1_i1:69-470(+)
MAFPCCCVGTADEGEDIFRAPADGEAAVTFEHDEKLGSKPHGCVLAGAGGRGEKLGFTSGFTSLRPWSLQPRVRVPKKPDLAYYSDGCRIRSKWGSSKRESMDSESGCAEIWIERNISARSLRSSRSSSACSV